MKAANDNGVSDRIKKYTDHQLSFSISYIQYQMRTYPALRTIVYSNAHRQMMLELRNRIAKKRRDDMKSV